MKTARLSEVCKLVNGGTPKSGVAEYWGGDVAWLTPAEMGKRITPYIAETARTITRTGLANCSARQVPVGAVIMSSRAPIGHLAIPEIPMAFNQGCRGLIPNETLDTKYLYYFLWFSRDALNELGTGATFTELSSGALANYRIPLPTLEEQRRIVVALDEAFAAITAATANAEKNLANARELEEAVVSEALRNLPTGTKSDALETFCESGRIITYGVIKLGDHVVDGVPCLRTSNVRWLEFELDGMKFIKPSLSQEYRRTILRGGEVLVNVRGTLGGVAVASEGMKGWNVSREVAVVPSASDRIDPQFLAFWIGSEESQKWLTGVLKGAAYTGINISDLRNLQVPLLPVPLQQAIVARISEGLAEARALSRNYEAKIDRLNALKQSLLHRAFSGGLTSKAAAVVALNDSFATPEFAAKIVAFAYERHVARNRVRNFGTVKAEKILHMVEAIGGIDLGRQPSREAAGPDDAKHRHATWEWARSQHFFRFNKRSGGGHDFEKLSSYSGLIEDARTAIVGSAAAKAIELLVDMDRDFAELIATTYAAWNNLIIDQCAATDDDIVLAARDNWHRDKLRFDPSRFHDAIRFIRNNSIVPDGTAKRVGGQEALLF